MYSNYYFVDIVDRLGSNKYSNSLAISVVMIYKPNL